MKKLDSLSDNLKLGLTALLLITIPLSLNALKNFTQPYSSAKPLTSTTISLPNTPYYSLNLVSSSSPSSTLTTNDQSTIIINSQTKPKINLQIGDSFKTNKTNLQLPSYDLNKKAYLKYSIWVKLLTSSDKPFNPSSCTLDETSQIWCLSQSAILLRPTTANKSIDVSKQLLNPYFTLNQESQPERYSLFDSSLENHIWIYSQPNFKLAQLRLYQQP